MSGIAQVTDVANAFSTTLTAGISATDTTITVDSTGDLTAPCYLIIEPLSGTKREVVLCDSNVTATTFVLSGVSKRGLDAPAVSHLAGAKVISGPVAQHIDDLNARVDDVDRQLTVGASEPGTPQTGDLWVDTTAVGGTYTGDFDFTGDVDIQGTLGNVAAVSGDIPSHDGTSFKPRSLAELDLATVTASDAAHLFPALTLIRYVDVNGNDANSGRGPGTSTAFATIGAALADVGTSPCEIRLGTGTWTEEITLLTGQCLRGAGARATTIRSATGDVITLGTSTVGAVSTHLTELTIHSQSGGGHCISIPKGWAMSHCTRVDIKQDNNAKNLIRCVRTATTGGLFSVLFNGGHWLHTATATVSGVYIVGDTGSSGNVCSDNRWENLRVQNSGDYFFHIECNSGAGTWNFNNQFVNMEAEVMEGGLVRLLTAAGTTFDNVWLHDNVTLTKSPFYLNKSAAGSQNRATSFRNCGRASGTLAASQYDIELAGTNKNLGTVIHEYTGPSAGGGTIQLGTNEYVGLVGHFANITFLGYPTDRSFKLTVGDGLDAVKVAIAGGTPIVKHLWAETTHDAPSIAAQSCYEFTITVTEAAVGMDATAHPQSVGGCPSGLMWAAIVSAANTVTVRICNVTAAAIDPPNTFWRVNVWDH